jgi:hypothetical protein
MFKNPNDILVCAAYVSTCLVAGLSVALLEKIEFEVHSATSDLTASVGENSGIRTSHPLNHPLNLSSSGEQEKPRKQIRL